MTRVWNPDSESGGASYLQTLADYERLHPLVKGRSRLDVPGSTLSEEGRALLRATLWEDGAPAYGALLKQSIDLHNELARLNGGPDLERAARLAVSRDLVQALQATLAGVGVDATLPLGVNQPMSAMWSMLWDLPLGRGVDPKFANCYTQAQLEAEYLSLQSQLAAKTTGAIMAAEETSAVPTVAGTASLAATAVAHGALVGLAGAANVQARDALYRALGEAVPEWADNQVVKDAALVLAPALMLVLVELAPQAGLSVVPDKVRPAVRRAAILALEHAGLQGSKSAVEALAGALMPMVQAYTSVAVLLPDTGEVEPLMGKISQMERVQV